MVDDNLNTRRTWLPADARRRLSVHGKMAYPVTVRSSLVESMDEAKLILNDNIASGKGSINQGSAAEGKSSELISPNTPFECGHEFSESTISGHKSGAASPVASQEVNSKPSLLPSRLPRPHKPQEALGTTRSLPGRLQASHEPTGGYLGDRQEKRLVLKETAREESRKAVDSSLSPHKLRTEALLARRPALSSWSEHSSNRDVPPGRQQQKVEMTAGVRKSREGRLRGQELQENMPPEQASPMEKSSAGKNRQQADWRYNQTFVKERQSSWRRPSIKVPGETTGDRAAAASAAAAVSGNPPENTDRSLPWPAISPKQAAATEQEAWYMEQVAEALKGEPLHLAAFKGTLNRCKTRAISAAAAHQQVAVILAGHPALVEGFAALLPAREQRTWPDVQPAADPPVPEERREEEQAIDNGRAKLLPTPPATTPQGSEQSAGRSSDATGTATQGAPRRAGRRPWPMRAWHALAPPAKKRYLPWCTALYTAACLFVFFYMAGGYGMFKVEQLAEHGKLIITKTTEAARQLPGGRDAAAAGQASVVARDTFAQYIDHSPKALLEWLSANPGWRSYDEAYLLSWGARRLPAVAVGHWWLWATAAFLHTNFLQLVGNLVPWVVVAFLLETRFGSLRTAPLFLATLLGAAFASAALGPPCGLVAGSNGLMAGMIPLLCASFLADWKTMAFPFLQLILCTAAVGLHLTVAIMQANDTWQSHWAELGAFVCGLLPGILFTPSPADKRWRPAARLAARCGLAVTSARTRGRKRRRAATASPANDTGAVSEEGRPLRSTGSAPRLVRRDEAVADGVARDVATESPMPARPTKRRLTAPRPDAAAHVLIAGPPEEEQALRDRWAPNSPGPAAAAEWRAQLDGSFRRPDAQLPYLRKEAARPLPDPDAIPALRAGSLHGSVEMALLNPDEQACGMEEGRAGENLRRHAPKQALHRQQASNESIASSLTSAATVDASAEPAAEGAEHAVEGGLGPRSGRSRRLCTACGVLRLLFCAASTVLFLGTLVGLPVYLYLVKLPSLKCPV